MTQKIGRTTDAGPYQRDVTCAFLPDYWRRHDLGSCAVRRLCADARTAGRTVEFAAGGAKAVQLGLSEDLPDLLFDARLARCVQFEVHARSRDSASQNDSPASPGHDALPSDDRRVQACREEASGQGCR